MLKKDFQCLQEKLDSLNKMISENQIIGQDVKQAISARERALCQLTVCFEFQSRSDRRKGHKSCALEMLFRRKVRK